MFRSLMFKTNPLAQELQRYRKKVSQTIDVKSFSIKKTSQINKKQFLQKAQNASEGKKLNPKSMRYEQTETLSKVQTPTPYRKQSLNNDKQKPKFKIHNAIPAKNDNYIQKVQVSPLKNERNIANVVKNKILLQNPQLQELISKNKFDNHKINKTNQYKEEKSASPQKISKKDFQKLDIDLQNQLKSTLYQSIDLGNLFQKIESNIDQSQSMKSSQFFLNGQHPLAGGQNDPNCIAKKTKLKHIQVNQHSLHSPEPQNKGSINQFNLKSLIDKKSTVKSKQIPANMFDKSFFESLTSRESQNKKDNQMQSSIAQFNEKVGASRWLPTRRKRSTVIVMDENGIIKEDSSNTMDDEESSLKMSMKISNLRHMMKGEHSQPN